MRRFELVEGTSSKFWEVELVGLEVKLAWGRIGTAGQTKSISFPSAATARAEYEKRLAGKLKEGYAERTANAGELPSATPAVGRRPDAGSLPSEPSVAVAASVDGYRAGAKAIWKQHVPKSGQARTVQGELLRAVGKLRDEAHRNGNGNWDDGHEILARFVRDTLVSSNLFAPDACKTIAADVGRVLQFRRPYTEDDLFDPSRLSPARVRPRGDGRRRARYS